MLRVYSQRCAYTIALPKYVITNMRSDSDSNRFSVMSLTHPLADQEFIDN